MNRKQFSEIEKYDVVTCVDFIEHFKESDQIRIIKRIDSILRPGGFLLIDTPRAIVSKRVSSDHVWELSWEDFEGLIKTNMLCESVDRYKLVWNSCFEVKIRCYGSPPKKIKGTFEDQILVARKKSDELR